MNKNYHIDVSKEEETLFAENNTDTIIVQSAKEKTIIPRSYLTIGVVVALHLVGVGCMFGFSSVSGKGGIDESSLKEDKEFVKQEPQSSPTPHEAPKVVAKPTEAPKQEAPKVIAKPTEAPKVSPKIQEVSKTQSTLTKEYVVKNGDTIYGIAKKYKLNTEKLIKLNDIKDANKVPVGKVLKFL
jgi:LysM repeat protein